MRNLLINIVATLENIEVHGSRNLKAMLGVIENLTKLLDACEVKVTEEEVKTDADCDQSGHGA